MSETNIDGDVRVASPNPKSRKYFSNNHLQYRKGEHKQKEGEEKNSCKICLDDVET